MTHERIQEIFKVFGKLLKLDDVAADSAAALRAVLAAFPAQHAATQSPPDRYTELANAVLPAMRNAHPIAQSLDRAAVVAKSAVDAFLRSIAPELNLSAASSPATILTALKTQMEVLKEGEATSVLTGGLFYGYFATKYNVQLPTAANPAIPDSWIATEVV